LKLYQSRFKLDTGKFAFSHTMFNSWDRLHEDIVSAITIVMNKPDRHLWVNWGLK